MRTHPVDKLLEQHCYKSAAGLLQFVRFDVCRFNASDCMVMVVDVKSELLIPDILGYERSK